MELIYKDALLKELGITDEECERCDRGDGNGYCTMSSDWAYVCDAICTAPVIEERKTGKWIDQKGGGCCCSECGKYALDEPDGNFIHVSVKSNFCPNCGADMRGEEHECMDV